MARLHATNLTSSGEKPPNIGLGDPVTGRWSSGLVFILSGGSSELRKPHTEAM